MSDYILQKGNVCFHPPYPHFTKRSMHSIQGLGQIWTRGGKFNQQGVVEWCDNRTGVPHCSVKPHPKTSSRAIAENFTIIRSEVFFRILRGYPTLHGTTIPRNFFLLRNTHSFSMQVMFHRNQDLRPDDINSGYLLRDCMFHLNSWIHFYEKPLLSILIEKKLNGSSIVITYLVCQIDSGLAKFIHNF